MSHAHPINRGQMPLDLEWADDEIYESPDDLADEYAEEMRLDNRDRARDQNAVK